MTHWHRGLPSPNGQQNSNPSALSSRDLATTGLQVDLWKLRTEIISLPNSGSKARLANEH
eukprot:1163350-Amphidinium_carterae.1